MFENCWIRLIEGGCQLALSMKNRNVIAKSEETRRDAFHNRLCQLLFALDSRRIILQTNIF